jgi:putative tryptophan/tyrosine transport system substrate-binding protein
MRRRDFIAVLGGGVAWPRSAYADTTDRVRQIAMLIPANDALTPMIAAFSERMQDLGWRDGANARIEVRRPQGDAEQLRRAAEDLLARHPDVVVTFTNLPLVTIRPMLGQVPAVFAGVGDPVANGFATSLAHPGGNITGFLSFEPTIGAKWLEILKETVPAITRVLTLYHPDTPGNVKYCDAVEAAAPRLGVASVAGPFHDADEIERAISSFATEGGGIIVVPSALYNSLGPVISSSAQRHRLPAISNSSIGAQRGDLVGYGPDFTESFRQAAGYVDRVLRGEKPGDLPVQGPTRYMLAINLKTAKALGLTIPPMLLARADEVIE